MKALHLIMMTGILPMAVLAGGCAFMNMDMFERGHASGLSQATCVRVGVIINTQTGIGTTQGMYTVPAAATCCAEAFG